MRNFFEELKHRNVIRVAIAYAVVGWLLAQVADLVVDAFNLPDAFLQMIIILLALGFPVAVFLAWAFELTPDGVVKAEDVPEDAPKDPRSGRMLNRITIATLLVAVVWLGWDEIRDRSGPAVESTAAVVDKSIAVLPFADFSPDGEQGWFADGLTDEILNALARTRDLRVASRSSAFQYRGDAQNIPTVAAELGVAHILEGSVRRAGTQLRITAQLIRAVDDVHLWSETFDGVTDDSIRFQEEIALKIARALKTAMDPDELERMLSAGTSSIEAWELYLQAESLYNDVGSRVSLVVELLEQSLEIDPEFVDAYISLADIWLSHLNPVRTTKYDQPISKEDARQRFYAAATKAAEFARSDADRAEQEALMAHFDLRLRDYVDAWQRAAIAQPDSLNPKMSLIAAHTFVGDYDLARGVGDQIREQVTTIDQSLTSVFMLLHRVDLPNSLALAEAVMALPNPSQLTLYQAHRVYLYAGKIEEAARLANLHRTRSTDATSIAMVDTRQACAEGRVADADAIFRELVVNSGGALSENRWLFLQTLGRNEEAIEEIRGLDNEDGLFALSGYLAYTHFDPRPFPLLMARLEAQGIQRPPPHDLPFACKRD